MEILLIVIVTLLIHSLIGTIIYIATNENDKIDDLCGDQIVVHGKGNKDRAVYLNAKAMIAIDKYLQERR